MPPREQRPVASHTPAYYARIPCAQALAKVAAKEAENGELMAMCDQLLQQQEAARRGDTAEAHDQR